MSSKDYWARREEEALKSYIKDEKEYDKQIKQIYLNMLDACQQDIDSFYSKFASKEGITIAEAKKRVSKLDIAEYERKAKRYVEAAEKDRKIYGKTNANGFYFSKEANDEMRIYNATMRINRLEMLKSKIGLELLDGHDKLDKFMADILQERTATELKRQAGILGKSVLGNAQKAHAIPNASFHNATFSERLWSYQEVMKADISKLLQQGLIQGKGSRELAKDLKKYYIGDERLKNGKSGARYRTETLMRTELARVQIEAQKQSFERNGFTEYEFIANSGCCEICQALNGKHFKVKDMIPGLNAPPMHPRCRCSTAAYSDGAEYEAWLDYLDKGGSTVTWNKWKDMSKAIDSLFLNGNKGKPKYSREDILEEMQKSPIGKDTIRAIKDSDVRIDIDDTPRYGGIRGEQIGNNIRIFTDNIKNTRVLAQTIIHEMAHYRFNIGQCQHAEAICFAMEKMHIMNRDYITLEEWGYVKKLAMDNYPEYNWEKGGYGDYDQFKFVKTDK